MLETYLRQKRQERDILLMGHIVAGYPSFDESRKLVDAMVAAGVDLIELQIPFSEPVADGPLILEANQSALAAGATVEQCLDLAALLCEQCPIPFVFMTYYNILFRHGVQRFVERAAQAGIKGIIVADLPHEEGDDYLQAMHAAGLAPIFIVAPSTNEARLRQIATLARGFIYCVARKGVTGSATAFSVELDAYLQRCATATELPRAVGFGVQSRDDVRFLEGKADIAVVGTQALRVFKKGGTEAVAELFRSLR